MIQRKAAASIKPTVIITNYANVWNIKTLTSLRNLDVTATEGIEYDESIVTLRL
jgi:hypothetical protein